MAQELHTDRSGALELHWTTINTQTVYVLYERGEHGQLALVDSFEQGPFDTSLEVVQWVLRTMTRRVRPSSC